MAISYVSVTHSVMFVDCTIFVPETDKLSCPNFQHIGWMDEKIPKPQKYNQIKQLLKNFHVEKCYKVVTIYKFPSIRSQTQHTELKDN